VRSHSSLLAISFHPNTLQVIPPRRPPRIPNLTHSNAMSSSMGDYEMFRPATSGQRSLAPTSAFGAHRGNPAERTGQSSRSREASREHQQYHQQNNNMVYRQGTSQPPSYLEAMAANDGKPTPVHYPQRPNGHEQSSYDDGPGNPTSCRSGLSDARSTQARHTAGTPLSTLNPPTAAHFTRGNPSSTGGTHTPTRYSGPGGQPDPRGEWVYVGRPSEPAGGSAVTGRTQTPRMIKSRTGTTGCKGFCLEIGCYGCLGFCQGVCECIGACL
jgi:hypothetical protein